MFSDRFHAQPDTISRPDVSFRSMLARTPDIKDEWGFVWDETLRKNIAGCLQGIQFDILLCNSYNVFYSPLQMKYKTALVHLASVGEAVLQYLLLMVEDDPRVRQVLGANWTWIDFKAVPTPGIEIPDGLRTVAGTQRKTQNTLGRNTKMKTLITAAEAVEVLDEALATKLHTLRDLRNAIHIKALDAPEYNKYTPADVNSALDAIETFRVVAMQWIVAKRAQVNAAALEERLRQRAIEAASALRAGLAVTHGDLGDAVVVALGDDDGDVVIKLASDDEVLWSVSAESLSPTAPEDPADDPAPF